MSARKVPFNRHLVDRLADAKADYDKARERYHELRAEVLESGETEGDVFAAIIRHQRRTSIDRERMEEVMGKAWSKRFLKVSDVTIVQVRPRRKAGGSEFS